MSDLRRAFRIKRRRVWQAITLPFRWLGLALNRYLGRALLFFAGSSILAACVFRGSGGDPLRIPELTLGATMVLVACVIPWIFELKASAGSGVGLSLKIREARQETLLMAELGAPELRADHALHDEQEETAATRVLLAEVALQAVFHSNDALNGDCNFHLYTLDDKERLSPVLEPSHPSGYSHDTATESWEIGKGVVGQAWAEDSFVRALGDECRSEKFGLSLDQQQRYADVQVVAAIPVYDASFRPIGVLSASSRKADSALSNDKGYDEMVIISQLAARVLIDVLKFFDD